MAACTQTRPHAANAVACVPRTAAAQMRMITGVTAPATSTARTRPRPARTSRERRLASQRARLWLAGGVQLLAGPVCAPPETARRCRHVGAPACRRWDAWARMTQPLLAHVPLLSTGGNHGLCGRHGLAPRHQCPLAFRATAWPRRLCEELSPAALCMQRSSCWRRRPATTPLPPSTRATLCPRWGLLRLLRAACSVLCRGPVAATASRPHALCIPPTQPCSKPLLLQDPESDSLMTGPNRGAQYLQAGTHKAAPT